jgi:hypothetical protein
MIWAAWATRTPGRIPRRRHSALTTVTRSFLAAFNAESAFGAILAPLLPRASRELGCQLGYFVPALRSKSATSFFFSSPGK